MHPFIPYEKVVTLSNNVGEAVDIELLSVEGNQCLQMNATLDRKVMGTGPERAFIHVMITATGKCREWTVFVPILVNYKVVKFKMQGWVIQSLTSNYRHLVLRHRENYILPFYFHNLNLETVTLDFVHSSSDNVYLSIISQLSIRPDQLKLCGNLSINLQDEPIEAALSLIVTGDTLQQLVSLPANVHLCHPKSEQAFHVLPLLDMSGDNWQYQRYLISVVSCDRRHNIADFDVRHPSSVNVIRIDGNHTLSSPIDTIAYITPVFSDNLIGEIREISITVVLEGREEVEQNMLFNFIHGNLDKAVRVCAYCNIGSAITSYSMFNIANVKMIIWTVENKMSSDISLDIKENVIWMPNEAYSMNLLETLDCSYFVTFECVLHTNLASISYVYTKFELVIRRTSVDEREALMIRNDKLCQRKILWIQSESKVQQIRMANGTVLHEGFTIFNREMKYHLNYDFRQTIYIIFARIVGDIAIKTLHEIININSSSVTSIWSGTELSGTPEISLADQRRADSTKNYTVVTTRRFETIDFTNSPVNYAQFRYVTVEYNGTFDHQLTVSIENMYPTKPASFAYLLTDSHPTLHCDSFPTCTGHIRGTNKVRMLVSFMATVPGKNQSASLIIRVDGNIVYEMLLNSSSIPFSLVFNRQPLLTRYTESVASASTVYTLDALHQYRLYSRLRRLHVYGATDNKTSTYRLVLPISVTNKGGLDLNITNITMSANSSCLLLQDSVYIRTNKTAILKLRIPLPLGLIHDCHISAAIASEKYPQIRIHTRLIVTEFTESGGVFLYSFEVERLKINLMISAVVTVLLALTAARTQANVHMCPRVQGTCSSSSVASTTKMSIGLRAITKAYAQRMQNVTSVLAQKESAELHLSQGTAQLLDSAEPSIPLELNDQRVPEEEVVPRGGADEIEAGQAEQRNGFAHPQVVQVYMKGNGQCRVETDEESIEKEADEKQLFESVGNIISNPSPLDSSSEKLNIEEETKSRGNDSWMAEIDVCVESKQNLTLERPIGVSQRDRETGECPEEGISTSESAEHADDIRKSMNLHDTMEGQPSSGPSKALDTGLVQSSQVQTDGYERSDRSVSPGSCDRITNTIAAVDHSRQRLELKDAAVQVVDELSTRDTAVFTSDSDERLRSSHVDKDVLTFECNDDYSQLSNTYDNAGTCLNSFQSDYWEHQDLPYQGIPSNLSDSDDLKVDTDVEDSWEYTHLQNCEQIGLLATTQSSQSPSTLSGQIISGQGHERSNDGTVLPADGWKHSWENRFENIKNLWIEESAPPKDETDMPEEVQFMSNMLHHVFENAFQHPWHKWTAPIDDAPPGFEDVKDKQGAHEETRHI